jgi:hypothetical protein
MSLLMTDYVMTAYRFDENQFGQISSEGVFFTLSVMILKAKNVSLFLPINLCEYFTSSPPSLIHAQNSLILRSSSEELDLKREKSIEIVKGNTVSFVRRLFLSQQEEVYGRTSEACLLCLVI